jgi:hypothetical protein
MSTTSGDELLSRVATDDFGSVSPSVYETGRLIRTAPWLDGHRERLTYLLKSQRPDGSWGPPDGYGLVPTLSSVDALLSEVDRSGSALDRGQIIAAANRGLHVLIESLGGHHLSTTPDTIAVEFIVPWLVEEVNGHLVRLRESPVAGLDSWCDARLTPPPDLDPTDLVRIRHAVRQDRPVPEKLWHTLEVLGADIRNARSVIPTDGRIGASPAATAAWLTWCRPGSHPDSVQYLLTMQARFGGPVPSVAPITIFERAWVISALVGSGMRVTVPPAVVTSLRAAFGDAGVPAGIGLPTDSDDTAGALHALALLGSPRQVDALWAYEANSHFQCFLGERTPSTTTNAHIVDALLDDSGRDGGQRRRVAVSRITRWLLDLQEANGSWWDKWHASPYYATVCCVQALARTRDPIVEPALCGAVDWVIGTQNADGSWGRWQATVEESAYALQIIVRAGSLVDTSVATDAVARGYLWLLAQPDDGTDPHPLWHDKDLYEPIAVVQAARIAASHMAAGYLDSQVGWPAGVEQWRLYRGGEPDEQRPLSIQVPPHSRIGFASHRYGRPT